MSESASRDLLRRLSLAAGPPGAEDDVREVVHAALADAGTIEHDRLGSVVCTCAGPERGPRVLLDAHLDEVAFLVQSVGADGELRIQSLGGWWGHVLPAQRVEVLTASGRIPGVVGSKPPHFLKPEERERVQTVDALFVDVGASDADTVERLGIRVGDPVVPVAEWLELAVDGIVSGKALDNRIGVGLLCETLVRSARANDRPNTLVGVASVQEELGARGAKTATALASPDVAVALEATPADDAPGSTSRQAVLGHGPQVRMFDPTSVANRRLVDLVREVAETGDIPLQVAVRRSGGTDAKTIHVHGTGVPTVVIGVPTRYIHTHVALMQWSDYEDTLRLVTALVARLDERAVARLVDFRTPSLDR